MTKADVLAGLAAKPLRFTTPDDTTVWLRPLRYGDRTAIMAWYEGAKGTAQAEVVLQRKFAALSICDVAGNLLLSEEEVDTLDPVAVDAIAKEASRRRGLAPEDQGPGKVAAAAAGPPPPTSGTATPT